MVKNDKGWLYLPVEVKVRDLDSKLLLSYYAAKEGYNVFIGDHIMVELASVEYPEGIFFSKGGPHGFRKRIITNAKNHGHTVVELDEEGLIINDKKKYLRDRMRRDMLQFVTQEYCWGSYQKEIIVGANPDYEEKCHIVGNPRLDLLKPKFSSIYKEDAEQISNKYGEFILINTRFSQYNSAKGKKDNIHFKHIKELYYNFLEMIKATCEKFPYTNIIIRPHPGENFESYRKALSGFNNIHVIHEGNIIKWLMSAKVIIHNGCTSGIEAFLLGKPLISYVPFNSNEVNIPNQLGMKATNIEEVYAFLKGIINKNIDYNPKYLDRNEKSLFYYCDWLNEKFSYESILHLSNKIHLPSPSTRKLPVNKNAFIIKDKKKRKRRFSLTEIEIQNFYRKLDEIEGGSSRITISELTKNLFKINCGK
ncbi:surface carbohydrate biosynthesis protein [Aquibacillus albus]|uniref:Surface carbohydrate biosynthesis protein n=1 Tax=Aquibacillus albus TaxID=1168171 RepID=A0ABS2N6C9_9BACI|nr:surface carbohydrate biosynthesis protein [Aquibacillus albus]MBM7573687.1 surface carbohydrate biosynthesis protein [Aquibacillus albus]